MASKTKVADTRLQTLQIYKVLQCVRANDKPQIEKLIELGIPDLINYTEPQNGHGALHIAASANDVEMCQFLLQSGAHPNIQDLNGCTPAMKATELGHDLVLEVLITANADISLVNNKGEGILFYCILPTKRHLRCLQILLDHGADVNNSNTNGFPVFLAACEQARGCKEMCLKLLDKGADPSAFNPATNRTALMEAAREGALDVVRVILEKGGDVNAIDKQRYHAVHFAAKGGFLEILMLLSAYGGDIGIIAMDGNTALHHAASGGFAVCCRFLGQRGCNPLWKNRDHLTPQAIAKKGGFKAAVKELRKVTRLYKKYSKPEVKNPNPPWSIRLHDWSSEHQAILRKLFADLTNEDGTVTAEDFTSVLTEKGAPVSPEELNSIIRLHELGRGHNINPEEFLKGSKYLQKTFLLSSYGPKKKKKEKAKKGRSTQPMPICMMPSQKDGSIPNFMIELVHNVTDFNRFDRDHPPVTPVIDDTGWYVDEVEAAYTHINFATKAGDLVSLTKAFKNGVPVDVKDTFYKTPLTFACAHGNMDAVKFLLEKGADVNVRDNFMWTPLHHACHAGQKDIAELLLKHGARINAAAIGGSTPLMRAVETGSLDCTHLLIQSGANVQMVNKKGENVLDVAKAYGDYRLIDLIQEKLDSLPKPKPKRGGQGKHRKERKSTAQPVRPPSVKEEQIQIPPTTKKSVLAKPEDLLLHEEARKIDITFQPKRAWVSEATSADIIKKREQRRYRFKDDADFENLQMPFNKNVTEKILTMAQNK